jgi:hypothetical protein
MEEELSCERKAGLSSLIGYDRSTFHMALLRAPAAPGRSLINLSLTTLGNRMPLTNNSHYEKKKIQFT